MRWRNFSIWRGRLPHWRADGVLYFAVFRHRRPLTPDERRVLYRFLMRPEGTKWDVDAVCVLPEQTQLLVRVRETTSGTPFELSDVLEKAKTRAGKAIVKKSGERFPPFYTESFDRIVRDESEYQEMLETMLADTEAEDGDEDVDTLYIKETENGDAFGPPDASN